MILETANEVSTLRAGQVTMLLRRKILYNLL